MSKTISELIKQAHDNAVNKGFYSCYCSECKKYNNCDSEYREPAGSCDDSEGDKNIGELLMLVVSELGEALEAHRTGRKSVKFDVFENDGSCMWDFTKEDDIGYFKGNIKDTFEDELADACIRIFDMCGYLNIEPVDFPHGVTISENVGEFLLDITRMICDIQIRLEDKKYVNELMYEIIHYIKVFCDMNNIDLEKHIELKMRYNETREYRHGKRY